MEAIQSICTYFGQCGEENTRETLDIAASRARELGIGDILVASTRGKTGALAAESMKDLRVTVVTHSAGFAHPNEQELQAEYASRIEAAGARTLTCQHALGGVGRAIRRKLGSYQVDEIIAFALRTFCDGVKVACEITLMATDAGIVQAGDQVVAIGGTGQGADSALVLRAANAQDYFDLRVLETLCKPRCGGRP